MRSVTLRRVVLVGAVAALPFLAACGGDGGAETGTGGRASSRRTTTTDAPDKASDRSSTTAAPAPSTAPPSTAPETTITTVPAPPSTAPGGGGGPVDAAISLTVEVTAEGQPLRSGTLTCTAGGASGTGHLADPAAAQAACAVVRDQATRPRLLNGPDPDRMCTMQYGGPEEARVTGQVDGQRVDTTYDRRDGCGISEWDAMVPLVGPAGA